MNFDLNSVFSFIETLVKSLVLFVIWIIFLGILNRANPENLVFSIGFILLNLTKTWFKKQILMKSFKKLKKNELKRQNQEVFVSHLLPLHVI